MPINKLRFTISVAFTALVIRKTLLYGLEPVYTLSKEVLWSNMMQMVKVINQKFMIEFWRLNNFQYSSVLKKKKIFETFVASQAKWHRSCYLKFNENKLQRARKREYEQSITNENAGHTCKQSRLQRQSLGNRNCILCAKDYAWIMDGAAIVHRLIASNQHITLWWLC